MIYINIFILTIIFVVSVLASGTSQLIKPFSKDDEKDIGKYHLAQIKPAGKYKVIVWHKMIDENNGEIYDKIFSVQNELGQFMIEKNGRVDEKTLANGYYNFTITPMKGTHLMQVSKYEQAFERHKIYAPNVQVPVDSLCNFTAEKRCIINYFETFDERISCLTNLLFIWLTNKFYGAMPERINFFLIAIFNDVIYEAKKKSEIPEKMTSDDATILGMIWTYLAAALESERLLPRIRMVDDQMVELINEFCKINKIFLLEHDELKNKLKRKYNYNSFCEQWPSKLEELAQFNNKSALDIELFHQIGKLFVDAKSKQMLTSNKIGASIRIVLDQICLDVCFDSCNFYANNETRHHHIVNLWKEQLCDAGHKFLHDVPSIGRSLYNLIKGTDDKKNLEVPFARTSSNV
uniref:Uncharacterized protein n=1 Tax=Globodera pallida TaxID=36090 RepID=A0A183CH01_GLOPA